MRIAVWADDESWKEFDRQEVPDLVRFDDFENADLNGFDACIQLVEYSSSQKLSLETGKPYFINDVAGLSGSLSNPSIIRFNGWKGFIEKDSWEVAGEISEPAKVVLSIIHKNMILVPDQPGMISPRVIAMIINEAYFALEEKVSSKADIDIAMKLGTNYPYGPFEWCERIGKNNVFSLLNILAETNALYKPAALLKKELN